ncbi:MAG: tetratricopeptide repeat protein [Sphingobacteriia bacterium]|nr:tetratricopeptide repeat protein [Sphingobacteriia bacterium]
MLAQTSKTLCSSNPKINSDVKGGLNRPLPLQAVILERIDEGITLMKEKKWDKAIYYIKNTLKLIDEYLEEDLPEYTYENCLYFIGTSFEQSGNLKEALKYYKRSFENHFFNEETKKNKKFASVILKTVFHANENYSNILKNLLKIEWYRTCFSKIIIASFTTNKSENFYERYCTYYYYLNFMIDNFSKNYGFTYPDIFKGIIAIAGDSKRTLSDNKTNYIYFSLQNRHLLEKFLEHFKSDLDEISKLSIKNLIEEENRYQLKFMKKQKVNQMPQNYITFRGLVTDNNKSIKNKALSGAH